MAFSPEQNLAAGQFNIKDLAKQSQAEVDQMKIDRDTLQRRLQKAPEQVRGAMQTGIDALTAKIGKNETFLAGLEPSAERSSKKSQEGANHSSDVVRASRVAAALVRPPSIILSPEVQQSVADEKANQIGRDYNKLSPAERGGQWDKIQLPNDERRAA